MLGDCCMKLICLPSVTLAFSSADTMFLLFPAWRMAYSASTRARGTVSSLSALWRRRSGSSWRRSPAGRRPTRSRCPSSRSSSGSPWCCAWVSGRFIGLGSPWARYSKGLHMSARRWWLHMSVSGSGGCAASMGNAGCWWATSVRLTAFDVKGMLKGGSSRFCTGWHWANSWVSLEWRESGCIHLSVMPTLFICV